MDTYKRKNIKDYTAWDINCPYIGSSRWKRKLKRIFRRITRKRLREELEK